MRRPPFRRRSQKSLPIEWINLSHLRSHRPVLCYCSVSFSGFVSVSYTLFCFSFWKAVGRGTIFNLALSISLTLLTYVSHTFHSKKKRLRISNCSRDAPPLLQVVYPRRVGAAEKGTPGVRSKPPPHRSNTTPPPLRCLSQTAQERRRERQTNSNRQASDRKAEES